MIYKIFLLVISSSLYIGVVQAQDNPSPNDQDSSSEQAEAREDAYRRQMELEGARDRDSYSNTTYTAQTGQEKMDKLPRESRDNIRDQLTDIIIENGQWEPFDALREYPYVPSTAAQKNPGLLDREEEAWAEQIEKYNQREAGAFEAARLSMPAGETLQPDTSPGPNGQQGHEQGEPGQTQEGAEGEREQQGETRDGEGQSQVDETQGGSQNSNSVSASSYDPNRSQQNDDADEISTAGVSQSALDFLRAKQVQGSEIAGRAAGSEPAMEQPGELSQAINGSENGAEEGAENGATAAQQSSQDSPQPSESELIIPGTIAIEDLDKLEGITEPEEKIPDEL